MNRYVELEQEANEFRKCFYPEIIQISIRTRREVKKFRRRQRRENNYKREANMRRNNTPGRGRTRKGSRMAELYRRRPELLRLRRLGGCGHS